MEKEASIKVSKENLKKLHQLAANYTLINGHKMTLNETISILIENAEKDLNENNMENKQLDKDRMNFIELINHFKLKGGPEDYNQCDFEDTSDDYYSSGL